MNRNWQAHWIWLKQAEKNPTTSLLARKEFTLDNLPARASLAVSANHIYRLYLNGACIGRGPDRADPRFPYFDAYEVREHLRPGTNVILALTYHSLPEAYASNENLGTRAWCLYNGPGGFIAQLSLDERVIATDDTWRMLSTPGWEPSTRCSTIFRPPIPRIDLSFTRVVDAAARSGFDDSAWLKPTVVGPNEGGLLPVPIPREIPPLVGTVRHPVHSGAIQVQQGRIENADPRCATRFYEPHPPIVKPSADGSWLIYDFGRAMGGFPLLELECNGGSVDLYCGDSLMWFQEEQLRLPSSGECRYESLDWRGCRYLALHFHDLKGPVTIKAVHFVEMVYPFEHRGDFRCSDPTLTRLWRICRDTVQIGTKDHPTDCGREQALWISDLDVHLRSMIACFGDVQPMIKAVHQMLRVMHDDGVLPVPGPVGIGYGRTEQELPWSEQPLELALILRDIYWFNNDLALARLAMPKLERMYAHFARYEDPRGLLNPNAKGLPALVVFCGWSFMLKENGIPAQFNFEYVLSLAAAAELARAIGRNDLADLWQAKSRKVLETLRRTFWDASRKMYVDGEKDGKLLKAFSTTVNAWAALAGGVDRADAGSWAEALRNDPAILQPICPYDATLLLDAFLTLGLDLHARELLDRYFGSIARNNEPTLPEMWSAGVSGMRYWHDTSRCHPFGSGPAYLSQWHILGVKPLVPGWSRVRIEPRSLGLENARGRVPTPHGVIGIEWERDELSWRLDIELPAGIVAEISLPRIGWGNQRLVVDGQEVESVHGWPAYRAHAHRENVDGFPRTLRCVLENAGRHHLVTESY